MIPIVDRCTPEITRDLSGFNEISGDLSGFNGKNYRLDLEDIMMNLGDVATVPRLSPPVTSWHIPRDMDS